MKTQRFAFCFPQWERALSIDIELERLRDELRLTDREHVLRPAAESLSMLSVVHQSGAASQSCAVRAQKKWRRHDEHSGRTSKELEEGTRRWKKGPLYCSRRTFRRESWLICWKVCACRSRSLLRRRLDAQLVG